MTAMTYPGHFLKTRRQALVQAFALMLLLGPLLSWRIAQESLIVAAALSALSFAPFAIAHRAWRFLDAQERLHDKPTPEMLFAFEMVAVAPLGLSALLMVLMASM